MSKAWEDVFRMPEPGRSMKPRTSGFTMVLDKGLGRYATEDLMATAADYIDFLKFSFGTSAFYDEKVLREKVEIVTGAGVDIYPGGTFLEVTVWQDRYTDYLRRAKELGFTAIEVSDGTLQMSDEVRADCIKRALDAGFKVLTEVGKKSPDEKVAVAEMHRLIAHDLELGALLVIVEAREAGRGVGIFDKSGAVKESEVDQIIAGMADLDLWGRISTRLALSTLSRPELRPELCPFDKLRTSPEPRRRVVEGRSESPIEGCDYVMWEAPIKNQQQYLIMRFGNNVNLGNVPTTDVLALEALRQGLRGDTLKRAIARGV